MSDHGVMNSNSPFYPFGVFVEHCRTSTTPLLLIAASLILSPALAANAFECALGSSVAAELGDGVTMHSCSWEKTPGHFVRTGPLQLVRHGVLILQLETDRDGRIQGEFTSWDDDGNVMETGLYRDGLKEGEWRVTDKKGNRNVVSYRAGIVLTP